MIMSVSWAYEAGIVTTPKKAKPTAPPIDPREYLCIVETESRLAPMW